jgi:hypothetical protein
VELLLQFGAAGARGRGGAIQVERRWRRWDAIGLGDGPALAIQIGCASRGGGGWGLCPCPRGGLPTTSLPCGRSRCLGDASGRALRCDSAFCGRLSRRRPRLGCTPTSCWAGFRFCRLTRVSRASLGPRLSRLFRAAFGRLCRLPRAACLALRHAKSFRDRRDVGARRFWLKSRVPTIYLDSTGRPA